MKPARRAWPALLWLLAASPAAPSTGAAPASSASAGHRTAWHLGGRAQFDHSHFSGVYSKDGQGHAATYLRRADIEARARWHPQWRASLELEADSALELGLANAFVSYQPGPRRELRLGRIDPDFGLEQATSSNWTYGIERSAIWDLLPDVADALEGTGARIDAHGSSWQTSAGLYDKRDHQAAVWRVAWWPVQRPGSLLQIGASVAATRHWQDDGRLRTRLAVRGVTESDAGQRTTLAPAEADAAYTQDIGLALEAAWQHGPWMLQAEALQRRLRGTGSPDRIAEGAYLLAAWSITGHTRQHDPQRARFGKPAGGISDKGAWETFYRLDLLRVRGHGAARVHTLGWSWSADQRWRVQLNLHRADAREAEETDTDGGHGLAARLQLTF